MKPFSFAWRTLRREYRYGELVALASALVLSVSVLCAVATLGRRVERSITASAAELIGGDVGISARRALPAELSTEGARLGLRTSVTADFPTVLFAHGKSQLADIRAVDAAYPLRGELRIRDANGTDVSARSPLTGTIFADHRLLAALDLKPGDAVQIGERELRIAAEIVREPDGGELIALAPRVLTTLDDATSAGLLSAGSRARYRLMAAGSEQGVNQFGDYLKSHRPDAAELVTVEQSQRNLRSAFERGEALLRFAALLTALLSGITVALAAQRFARRKTDEVALLRCLGASGSEVVLATTSTLAMLATPACMLGAVLGIGLQELVFGFARRLLPAASSTLPLEPSVAAFAVGLAVLLGFALPPLLRLREVPPVRVFQRAVEPRVRRFDALYLLPIIMSVVLIYMESDTLKLADILGASLFAVFLLAFGAGVGLLRVVSGLNHATGTWRFGVANLARRRALSLLQIIALALALTALDLLAIVGPSLLGAWRAELPADTPNYFVINIQPEQHGAVLAGLQAAHADNVNSLPMAVGKLVAINGNAPRTEDYADRRAAGWINGETRLSWSAELPPGNRVLAGRWFPAHPTEPEVSVDEMWVDMFHLHLGDTLTLRVGERDIVARVTSVRGVRWDSFRANFFLLLDPDAARGLPYSDIASFHIAPAATDSLAKLAHNNPNLSLIDLNALLDRVRDIINHVSSAVTSVLAFSLVSGLLVLIAAVSASADERRFESALVRTLGASRGQLIVAVLAEFATVGALAGIIAACGAGLAGLWLARSVFQIAAYVPPVLALAMTALATIALVTFSGFLGTRRVANASPLLVLRRT
jgi:putative ABC transport system permease protein